MHVSRIRAAIEDDKAPQRVLRAQAGYVFARAGLTPNVRSLTLRIYLTVLLALALFALVSGWLVQRHVEHERERFVATARGRTATWVSCCSSLPAPTRPGAAGRELREWSGGCACRWRWTTRGARIGADNSAPRAGHAGARRTQAVPLDDDRTLWVMRPPLRIGPPGRVPGATPVAWWPAFLFGRPGHRGAAAGAVCRRRRRGLAGGRRRW